MTHVARAHRRSCCCTAPTTGSRPCVQSERLYRALLEAGVERGLVLYPGADHMWLGAPDAAQSALSGTTGVLRRRLDVRR